MAGAPSFVKNISGMDADEYDLDSYQPGMSESVTVLPRVNHTGGVTSSANPYGQIVKGSKHTGAGESLTISELTHSIPSQVPRAGEDHKNEVAEEEEVTEEVLAVVDPATMQPVNEAQPIQPAKREKEYLQPREVSNAEYLESLTQDPIVAPVQAIPAVGNILDIERKRIRVRISGSKFGNYKGHYVHVVDGPDYLILFYDVDDTGYEPPYTEKGDPITVRCEDKEHKVYYMGMDFDLQMNNLGMQVYIKHKE
jgi:hypothetical protein